MDMNEWREEQALRKAKTRLRARQRALVHKLTSKPETFRRDEKIQTELRRVAKLCLTLDVPLFVRLEEEIFNKVHES